MWIKADTIITMAGEPFERCAIHIENGRIADIIPIEEVPSDVDIRNFPGGIAFPAFVNMHTHLFWSGFRGAGDDLPLADWVYDRLVPLLMEISEADKAGSVELGIKRTYEAGITTVLDAHLEPNVFEAAVEKKLRGIFFLEGFGIYSLIQKDEIKRVEDGIGSMLKKATPDTKVGFSPHAPYTVTPAVLKNLLPYARELGLPLMTHLAETVGEREYFTGPKGVFGKSLSIFPEKPDLKCASPFDYYEKYGLFGPDIFLVHCVDLTREEIKHIADYGSKIVTCPTSNAKLACGIAPVMEMLEAGISVYLGTDSEASCDEFDMFEEMRRLILLQRAGNRKVVDIDAKSALEMCTSNAAKAAGFDDIGTIEKGKTADIVVATPDNEGVSQYRDAYGKLVWSMHKNDIKLVMTRGEVVFEQTG